MHSIPRNVGKRRDVVERLRGNRNLSAKEEGRAGKSGGGRTWRSRMKRETRKNEGGLSFERLSRRKPKNEWHSETVEVAVVRWWREGRAPVPALLP
ncbi:Uncharacterized protein DBV15_06736 [Temnothorax longispinosus]|uniref:Uncharacterized protein n=1 Tax=Temnothorax longispinosus TaxID=300112 RepID=A0A4S2JR85_9HYME|nr:Uncharacterized protein DBV15_06736 [Temnothorax longispinosus]